eukprot:TRINITY_DN3133_c0_g1_i1.p1 TRINITY_DN3133_c0_g1~~TRINITY_DN3133_c0_g1_i1.p1  ORF type:complete len:209 (+),score=27.33 TRINITY_DN3133_c0_g1_i1:565-1191(+)
MCERLVIYNVLEYFMQIYFRIKKGGGLAFNAIVPQSHLDGKVVQAVLHEYKIFHADVVLREDCTVDDFIDVLEGNRKYCQCIYVYNKIDCLSVDEVDALARRKNAVAISCQRGWNLDTLLERLWETLDLVRVFTKKRGEWPDFKEPVILTCHRGEKTVETTLKMIHRNLCKEFKYALVWGRSSKHSPQRVGIAHVLRDQDVLQIVKRL